MYNFQSFCGLPLNLNPIQQKWILAICQIGNCKDWRTTTRETAVSIWRTKLLIVVYVSQANKLRPIQKQQIGCNEMVVTIAKLMKMRRIRKGSDIFALNTHIRSSHILMGTSTNRALFQKILARRRTRNGRNAVFCYFNKWALAFGSILIRFTVKFLLNPNRKAWNKSVNNSLCGHTWSVRVLHSYDWNV